MIELRAHARGLLSALALALGCVGARVSGGDPVADILALEAHRVRAWAHLDPQFIESATAPDATWINNRGYLADKKQSLA